MGYTTLRAGRSVDRIPVGARFSAPVQTDPGAYPASCTMGTGSFPGVKRPGRGVDHPPLSSAEVKERVELYLCSPSGASWPVLGWTLLYFTRKIGNGDVGWLSVTLKRFKCWTFVVAVLHHQLYRQYCFGTVNCVRTGICISDFPPRLTRTSQRNSATAWFIPNPVQADIAYVPCWAWL
jgi:hypothetical protein